MAYKNPQDKTDYMREYMRRKRGYMTADIRTISTIAEPYGVKIERNSKGYNYEVSVHGAGSLEVLNEAVNMKNRLEKELGLECKQKPLSEML